MESWNQFLCWLIICSKGRKHACVKGGNRCWFLSSVARKKSYHQFEPRKKGGDDIVQQELGGNGS